ncbi:CaiB/BaiF CoA-transferase family protein [Sinorhizobium sp. 7-81]|uniref:CaiB/BaiF CoA transferase family protein n=1 Tax=Sinorhizobium sp. 8-89 TaxID=3049089 RepID=UPI0024C319DC|nr:CaiB/BaiF CoA-transferase family protein [Sinorhizobium sp. 8-89]MDK1493707.1 CaiB/BaiF CoA-transferase family protein [Sinorhizobium sp. 8-89]
MPKTALDGIRVVAFTHFAAGPIAAQYMGSLGADVIKIESPAQDVNRYALRDPDGHLQGISPYFVVTNRNQRNACLNLKTEDGLTAAKALIASSDVLIENYRPGVMEKLGLGYEEVKKINPRIIYASISAYDPEGSAGDRPGQDLLIQALSGIASLTGRGDGPPIPVGAYIIDGFTAMQVLVGILAALRHRDATGEGQAVRADMMSSSMFLMSQEASYILNVNPNPIRSSAGIAHVNQSAPYGVYQVKDGAIVLSTFGGVPMVKKLVIALQIEDLTEEDITEQKIRFNRDQIAGKIAKRLATMSIAEATAIIEPTGTWTAPVRTLGEALADPAVVETGIIQDVNTPYGGQYKVVVEPLRMEKTPLVSRRPAAALGEHTKEVLAEIGLSSVETV